MFHLYCIAHRIDIRCRGFHPVIDCDAAFQAQLQPCVPCQCCIRRYTDGQNHHIPMKRRSILQKHIHTAVRARLKTFHRIS